MDDARTTELEEIADALDAVDASVLDVFVDRIKKAANAAKLSDRQARDVLTKDNASVQHHVGTADIWQWYHAVKDKNALDAAEWLRQQENDGSNDEDIFYDAQDGSKSIAPVTKTHNRQRKKARQQERHHIRMREKFKKCRSKGAHFKKENETRTSAMDNAIQKIKNMLQQLPDEIDIKNATKLRNSNKTRQRAIQNAIETINEMRKQLPDEIGGQTRNAAKLKALLDKIKGMQARFKLKF